MKQPHGLVVSLLQVGLLLLLGLAFPNVANANPECTHWSPDLETIYYKLMVTLNAANMDVVGRCNNAEIAEVGEVIDNALMGLDFEDKHKNVKDVTNHLCIEQDYTTRRRELGWSVSSQYLVFYIFRGGGRCRFCTGDDKDHRRLAHAIWSGKDADDETFDDLNVQDLGSGLRGIVSTVVDEAEEGIYTAISDEPWTGDHDGDGAAAADDLYMEEHDYKEDMPHLARNLTSSNYCGCHWINFDRDGKGRKIYGTPYMVYDEWLERYGFTVRVTKVNGHAGYAPDSRVRMYNTAHKPNNQWNGDFDLGAPNKACGGPGEGRGGEPFRPNGQPNPGANCKYQGKVMIIQETKKITADDNYAGGTITFEFKKGQVELREVGLLDVEYKASAAVRVRYKEGGVRDATFQPVGYGENSHELMKFRRKNTKRVDVDFKGGGAITKLSFCYKTSCPPSGGGNSNHDPGSIEYFNSNIRPDMEARAIHKITNALRDASMRDPKGFCLGPTEASVDVDTMVAKSIGEICRA